jgi:hypothetical protein
LLHASSTGSPGGGGGGSIGSSSSSSSPASHPHASLLTSGHHIHHPSGNTLLHPGHHPHGSSLSNPSTAAAVAHAYATQMMFNSSSLSQASAFSQALAAGQSFYLLLALLKRKRLHFLLLVILVHIWSRSPSSASDLSLPFSLVIWSRERVSNCMHPLLKLKMTTKASILVCSEGQSEDSKRRENNV